MAQAYHRKSAIYPPAWSNLTPPITLRRKPGEDASTLTHFFTKGRIGFRMAKDKRRQLHKVVLLVLIFSIAYDV